MKGSRRKKGKGKAKTKKRKPKVSAQEKPAASRKWVYATVAAIALLIPAAVFLYLNFSQPAQAKAAIIDQLNSFHPNQTFKQAAEQILLENFDAVDYFSEATVQLYEKLPMQGYKLIVWRTHSALGMEQGELKEWVAIASSEKYRPDKYANEVEAGQIAVCNLSLVDTQGELYFSITPRFIKERMQGKFSETVIILLSCNGLRYSEPAEAFLDKGAKAVISWSFWVDPTHNDNAGTLLLRLLIEENMTIDDAVKAVPPDKSYEIPCQMRYSPRAAGSYRIPNYKVQKAGKSLKSRFFQSLMLKEYVEQTVLKKASKLFMSPAYDKVEFLPKIFTHQTWNASKNSYFLS